jgi:hypothetical protein
MKGAEGTRARASSAFFCSVAFRLCETKAKTSSTILTPWHVRCRDLRRGVVFEKYLLGLEAGGVMAAHECERQNLREIGVRFCYREVDVPWRSCLHRDQRRRLAQEHLHET